MVLAIIGISIIVSMMRGAVKEMLAIIGWLVAFYVAKTYASVLSPMLPQDIPTEALKTLAAFLILLIAVLFINSLLSIAISSIISKVGLGWLNRLLGIGFGFAKGVLIVCVLVFLAGLTSLPKERMWTDAVLSSPLEELVKSTFPWLPYSVTKHVKFD
jgi:membrane protein required for colicin V production